VNEFSLYWRYVKIHVNSQLQYKSWPMEILFILFIVLTDPLDAMLMLDRFGSVGGYSASQIMLVYALAVISYGVSCMVARGFDYFPRMLRGGEFDRVLLRPRSLVLQTAAQANFQYHRLCRVIGMGFVAAACLRAQGVAPSARVIGILLCGVLGGALIYQGLFMLFASFAVFTLNIEHLSDAIIFGGILQTAKTPPGALPEWMRVTFTYIFPSFLFCYYPAAAACGWGESVWMGFMAIPAGVAFFGLSLALWGRAVLRYKSTGS